MSEEKDKKDIDHNNSKPEKSAASNEKENSKAPPKEKSTDEKLKELFTKIIDEKQMSEAEKDELIDAQKQVIGILFEVIKRLQTNNNLDEEYFEIITD